MYLLISSYNFPEILHSKKEIKERLGNNRIYLTSFITDEDTKEGYCNVLFLPISIKTFEEDFKLIKKREKQIKKWSSL